MHPITYTHYNYISFSVFVDQDDGHPRGEAPRGPVRDGGAGLPSVQQHPQSVGVSRYVGAGGRALGCCW